MNEDMDLYMARQRVKAKTIRARADAALTRLRGGGEAKTPSDDAAFVRKMIAIWKRGGRGRCAGKSTLHFRSGRTIVWNHQTAEIERDGVEMAIARTPRHLKKRR